MQKWSEIKALLASITGWPNGKGRWVCHNYVGPRLKLSTLLLTGFFLDCLKLNYLPALCI